MYSSLEARSPFLDHRIAEFVCPLPWEYKLKRESIILKTNGFLEKSFINMFQEIL